MKALRPHMLAANYVTLRKAYLDEVLLPAFEGISQKTVPVEKFYVIAGRTILLRFYSTTLAERLTNALAHNEIAKPAAVNLTVNLWDGASSGVRFVPPWSDARYAFDQKVNAKTLLEGRFKGVYLHGQETLVAYDADSSTAYYWTENASLLPSWVSAAPLRTLLHWFLSEGGVHLVHGAVVGSGDAAVLLSARGGSGKSTTALACLLSGMDYLADDYAGIEVGDGIVAHSLYNSVKVAPGGIHAWQGLAPYVRSTEGEKDIVFLSEVFPRQIVRSLPLRAVIIPVIKHAEATRIVPASKAQALLALAPTSIFQLPLAETDKLETLRSIVERLPCYFAELGTDSAEAAHTIDDFIRKNLC